MNLRNTM